METANQKNELATLIHTIVTSLVDKPDEVRVTTTEGQNTSFVEVQVADGDVGKVIGSKGYTASAIRLILNNAAMKQRRHAMLNIVEPERRKN